MPDLYLVCEGHADGLDFRVLDVLVAQRLGAAVQIEPAGGGTSLRSVSAYLEKRGEARALTIEDRDYRRREDAEATWSGGGRSLVWRRHEIENYLLEPQVVLAAFTSLRHAAGPWAGALPAQEPEVRELLDRIAGAALETHVAQVLRWELYTSTTRGNPAELRVPPGANASWRRAEWLEALCEEASRIQKKCGAVAGLKELEPASIEQRFEEILGKVQLEPRSYLHDVGGKELLEALVAHLGSLGATGGSKKLLKLFETELVSALAKVYEPGQLFVPDEFVLLKDRLAAL